MKHYLLDTNIISYLADSKSIHKNKIKSNLTKLNDADIVSVSIITLYELSYGFYSFKSKDKNEIKIFKYGIEFIKSHLNVIPLDVSEIDIFGKLKSSYKENTGIKNEANKKNDLDFLITATAINHNAILVSNDNIFETLSRNTKKLRYENWTK